MLKFRLVFPQQHKGRFSRFRYLQAMRVDSHTHDGQAMRVLIHTHISCRLLVEGSAPKPHLNTEFHSVAARSPNASVGYAKTPSPSDRDGTNRSALLLLGLP